MSDPHQHLKRYTLLGAAFGLGFPLVATLLQATLSSDGLSWSGIVAAQSMPLLWIIDTAPLFLGWFAAMAGMRQDRLAQVMVRLEEANTVLEERNQALAVANDELVRASQLKSQFLANMSHELRTPLNAIIGFSRILLKKTKGQIAERQEKNLQMVHESGNHLLALVNDILDIERIEAGMLTVKPTEVDAVKLCRDVVAKLGPAAAAKGITLTAQLPDVDATLRTDAMRLRQVLDNLVNNAIKYSDRGQIVLRFAMPLGGNNDMVQFEVKDEGIGIAPDLLGSIFEPFWQVDGSTTRAQGGVGLGLHLVNKMVALLGGTVTATSEVGKGSTFLVSLPLGGHDQASVQAPAAIDLSAQGAGPKVLIIDDTPSMIELMRTELVDAGFEVHAATSGAAGVALAEQLAPKVVLLDIIMPGMDGWEVLKTMKASPRLSTIPVVVTSQLDNNPRAQEFGVGGWLTKPTTPEAFRAVFQRLGIQGREDVLVVEDDEVTRDLVVQQMQELDLRTRTANNGAEAIVSLGVALPRLMVLDLMMPKLDGFAVLEHLRGLPAGKNVPVVIYTAKDLSDSEMDRLQDGPVDVLHKGGDRMESLVERVRAAMGQV